MKRRTNIGLPIRVYERSGSYYYVMADGKWLRLGGELEGALSMHAAITGRSGLDYVPIALLKTCLTHAKKNARARNRTCELTWPDVLDLWMKSGGRCVISKIPFTLERAGTTRRRPWAPSIDRIDNERGYSANNCRLVCVAVNLAMGGWGEEVLRRMSLAIARNTQHFGTSKIPADSVALRAEASD